MLHQDKKRWKQVKHHWFDIIQPIRPHLRWKFFTISCENVTILFSMWQEKLKIFMEWTVFSFIAILFLILLYMFAIKKSINTLKWPNPEIFKLHHIRGWSQILEFYISYQFFRTDVLHQDKKRWKQVKHHWFDIIEPIRPHLRWKFFTTSCKNVTILFSMWQEKLKIFMEWTVFSFIAILFLILLYMFAIKKSINTLKWPNPEIFKLYHIRGWSQILEIYISYQFCSTDVLHQDKKRWKQVKHHWFDIIEPIRPHLRWKFFTIGSKYVTILFSMWQLKLNIFMEWTVFSFIAILFLILLYMFAIKKLINTLKWPNTEIFKLHNIRSWSQILEFYISYQFA